MLGREGINGVRDSDEGSRPLLLNNELVLVVRTTLGLQVEGRCSLVPASTINLCKPDSQSFAWFINTWVKLTLCDPMEPAAGGTLKTKVTNMLEKSFKF